MAALTVVAVTVAGLVTTVEAAEAAPAKAVAASAKPVRARQQDDRAALARARSTRKRVEVISERNATETLWADPEGTFTRTTTVAPIRAKKADGSWASIDTTLAVEGGRLAPKVTTNDVTMSATGEGALATFKPTASTSFSMSLANQVTQPTLDGSTAVYDVTGNTQVRVRVTANDGGFSERLKLASAPATAATYTFPLALKGLKPSLDNGALTLTDASGKVVAESAPFTMWDSSKDAAGDRANQVAVDSRLVTGADGITSLVLTPSLAWLTAETTKYPVTVDPDVTGLHISTDTYISNKGNAGNNYRSDYRTRVGSNAEPGELGIKFRGIETFNTGDYNGRDIKSATLSMYQYYGSSCSASIKTYVWPTNGKQDTFVTWANQKPTISGARWYQDKAFNNGNSTCTNPTMPDAWVDLDVTKMTKGMTSGIFPSGSYQLQADGDDSTNGEDDTAGNSSNGDKRFCSGNPDPDNPGSSPCTVSSLQPTLSITYWPELGVQKWYSMTEHPLNARSTLKVNNDGGNAVIQAQDVRLNGRGLDLSIDRFYNSQSTDTTSLGTGGWSLSVGPDVFLESSPNLNSFDYVGPGATRFGSFFRKTMDSSIPSWKTFSSPTLGGLDADLSDESNDTNGIAQMTMTFHGSQQKYVFKKVDTSTNNRYLTQIRDRSDNNMDFTYVTGTHTLQSIADSEGRTISFTYTSGRITQITSTTKAANGTTDVTRTWKYGYTGSQLTSYTNPDNKVTTYDYTNGLNITEPANQSGLQPTTAITYYSGNATQQVTYSRAAGDVVFVWQYFNAGGSSAPCPGTPDRWTKVTDLTTGDDAVNKGPTYCFTDRKGDATNKKRDVVDALNNTKGSSYTADSQSDTATTAGNSSVADGSTVSTYSSSLPDQLSSVTEPKDASDSTAGTTGFNYAASASTAGGKWLPTSKLDPQGKCNNFGYDSKGRTTDAYTGLAGTSAATCGTNGNTGAAHFHKDYNSDGSINWSTDGNVPDGDTDPAKRTNFTYWAATDSGYVAATAGQLKTVVKPGGSCTGTRHLCTSYSYDGAGRVASITDGRNIATRYTYDNLDRTTQVQLNGVTTCSGTDISNGNCLTYAYDDEGNLKTRVEKGGTTTWTYDRMNRQLSESQPAGISLSWTRDGAANLKSFQQNVNGTIDTVTYAYDPANRPKTVTDATGTFSMTPDSDGRIASLTYPISSGLVGAYDYTRSGKPKTIGYTKSGAPTPIVSYTFSYKVGSKQTNALQKKTVTGSTTALNGVFTYDYSNSTQLTNANNDSGDDYTYDYDKAGNLTRAQINTSSSTYYGYDRAGELCWSGTGTTAPSSQLATACPATPSGYTARTSDHAGNNLGTTASPNTYNANSQAVTVGGVSQSYLDLGNDLRTTTGATTTINGPLGVTAQKIGSAVVFFTRDSTGTLLNQHGAAGTHYYMADYQGSVSTVAGSAGALDGSYSYDPYGKTTVNAVGGNTTLANNPWRYTGGYQDLTGAGYYHLGARYYDSAGHFTQPDSLQGSIENPKTLNSYGYAAGDPINNVDPSGHGLLACAGSAIGLLSGVGLVISGLGAEAPSAGASSIAVYGGLAAIGTGLGFADDCLSSIQSGKIYG